MTARPEARTPEGTFTLVCFVCGETRQGSYGDVMTGCDCRLRAAEAKLARARNALAILDGHTCHEGHTDADHLRLLRAAVAEFREALR